MRFLTDDEIKADIQKFETRLQTAFDRLGELPGTALSWKEKKKLDAKRQLLKDEINHVRRLIGYAIEALSNK